MTTVASPLPSIVEVLAETETRHDEWVYGLRAIGARAGITYYARVKHLCESGKLKAKRVQNTNPISNRRYPYQWMARVTDIDAWRGEHNPSKASASPATPSDQQTAALLQRLTEAVEVNTRELIALRLAFTSPAI